MFCGGDGYVNKLTGHKTFLRVFVACHLCAVLDLFRPSLLVSAESTICRRHRITSFVRPLVLWTILIIMTLFVVHNVVHNSKQECITVPIRCSCRCSEGGESACLGGVCLESVCQGCLPRGVSAWGYVCPVGVCPGVGCLARGETPPPPTVNRITDRHKNITSPQLLIRMVNMTFKKEVANPTGW